MSILKKAAELFSPNDPELVEKTLVRIGEQDTWNDVFSTKLIDLLDNADGLKAELRKRMRSVEQYQVEAKQALEQASSHLARACSAEEKATRDLQSARQTLQSSQQNLDAAQESAALAQGKHMAAALIFRKASLLGLSAMTFTWIALVWATWVSFRSLAPVWAPCVVTAIVLLAAGLIANGFTHDA